MQDTYDQAEQRDVHVIAVSQEDRDLESHARFYGPFKPEPRFEILADLQGEQTSAYKRTTTYYISDGVVKQVFPQSVSHRATWSAIFDEIDRIREVEEDR